MYGGRALANTVVASDDSYSGTSNKMASIAFDASAMIPASAVWTWTNGHLMSDGKYLANPSGTDMAMVDNEADALTFEYQDDFYGDGKILKATNAHSYYDTLGLSNSVDGSMGLVSAYSNDALVTLYEATVVPAEADHAYVDGVCACGHKEFVYMKGDVNNNGKMNIVDAQVAYDLAANKYVDQALSNLLSLWGNGVTIDMVKTVANYNGDDALDATDAFAIQVAVHAASAA